MRIHYDPKYDRLDIQLGETRRPLVVETPCPGMSVHQCEGTPSRIIIERASECAEVSHLLTDGFRRVMVFADDGE